jgi:hypothetical protein
MINIGKLVLLITATLIISSCSQVASKACKATNILPRDSFPARLKDDIDNIVTKDEAGWEFMHKQDPDIAETVAKAKSILSNSGYCFKDSLNYRTVGFSNSQYKDKSYGKTSREYLVWFIENAPKINAHKNAAIKRESERINASVKANIERESKLRSSFIANGYSKLDLLADFDSVVVDINNGNRNLNSTKSIVFNTNFSGYKASQVLEDMVLFSHVYTGNVIAIKKQTEDREYIDGMSISNGYISLLGTYSYKTVIGSSKKVLLFRFVYPKP